MPSFATCCTSSPRGHVDSRRHHYQAGQPLATFFHSQFTACVVGSSLVSLVNRATCQKIQALSAFNNTLSVYPATRSFFSQPLLSCNRPGRGSGHNSGPQNPPEVTEATICPVHSCTGLYAKGYGSVCQRLCHPTERPARTLTSNGH